MRAAKVMKDEARDEYTKKAIDTQDGSTHADAERSFSSFAFRQASPQEIIREGNSPNWIVRHARIDTVLDRGSFAIGDFLRPLARHNACLCFFFSLVRVTVSILFLFVGSAAAVLFLCAGWCACCHSIEFGSGAFSTVHVLLVLYR